MLTIHSSDPFNDRFHGDIVVHGVRASPLSRSTADDPTQQNCPKHPTCEARCWQWQRSRRSDGSGGSRGPLTEPPFFSLFRCLYQTRPQGPAESPAEPSPGLAPEDAGNCRYGEALEVHLQLAAQEMFSFFSGACASTARPATCPTEELRPEGETALCHHPGSPA